MQAIILAGGFGTRLRSVLADVPKPMAPIHDKPFLAHLIAYLAQQGVTRVFLSVYYLKKQIQDYFAESYRGISIAYVEEDKPLGTGGAIRKSLEHANPGEPVFVLNGDTFLKMDYRAMYQQHLAQQAVMTMALRQLPDCSRYGVVTVEQGVATAFQEKGHDAAGFINAGVYLLNQSIFSGYDLPEIFSFERDFLFPDVSAIRPHVFIADDYFIDIGIPEDYARAIRDFA